MNWVRIKRWLAEHPAACVTAIMIAIPPVAIGVPFLLERGGDWVPVSVGAPFLVDTGDSWTPVVMLVVCAVVLSAYVYWLTTLRRRAGLSLKAVEKALARGFVVGSTVPTAVGLACWFVADGWRKPILLLPASVIGLLVVAGWMVWPYAASGIAMSVADKLAARRFRLGQWETTRPLADDDEDEQREVGGCDEAGG